MINVVNFTGSETVCQGGVDARHGYHPDKK